MKQNTCAIQDSFDAVKFLDEIQKSSDYSKAKAVLVNIFTERTQKDYISYITGIVKAKLPKARISGLTCISSFAHGEILQKSTIFTVFFFFQSEIEVLEFDFSKTSEEDVKSSFIKKINGLTDIQGIQVFTTPLNNSISNDFLSAVNIKDTNIPIFGASAGFKSGSKKGNLYVFGNEIYENGSMITIFRGKKLKIYAESTLGWNPIGKEMTVTDVIDNHILKTIDNETAGEIYKKYLGVTASKFFIENTCEFPFMLKRGGKWLARIPVKKDKNGFIHFTSDIHKGEKLVFSYGSKKVILQQAFNLAEYMSRKNLEGLLLHLCRNRQTYLKENELLELQAFSNFYRETAGCYAFAEILYKNNSGGLQNSALTAIGFREIENAEESIPAEDCYIEDTVYSNKRFIDFNNIGNDLSINQKDKPLPFEERLVHFLHATSRDLYAANEKLEEAATIDGLTKIFNRKKISERISCELNKDYDFGKLCLIMFDIDNFKRINDTYGHDAGDEVLVKVSRTAKECIGAGDSIGRWGGEEFMILLPARSKEEAASIAEEIRKSIHALEWENMNAISISLGVASARKNDDILSFYKRVDNRLYYAKTHGKNRVISEDLE